MQFRGRYYFLSNFYPCTIVIDGFEYQSAEAAFQGQKSVQHAHLFTGDITPIEAKRLGRRVPIDVREWNARRLEVMKRVVWAKFAQNPKLRKLLIAVTSPLLKTTPGVTLIGIGVEASAPTTWARSSKKSETA